MLNEQTLQNTCLLMLCPTGDDTNVISDRICCLHSCRLFSLSYAVACGEESCDGNIGELIMPCWEN